MWKRLLPFDPSQDQKLNNPFWFLLSLLVLLLFPAVSAFVGARISLLLLPTCYTLVVIIGSYTVAKSRRVFRVGIYMGLGLLVLVWFNYSQGESKDWFDVVMNFALLTYFSFLFNYLARNVLQKEKIDLYVLYGVIAGYLILGVVGAELFSVLEIILPGSFLRGGELLRDYDYIYFAFVTLTTLGYGDIAPANGPCGGPGAPGGSGWTTLSNLGRSHHGK